MRRYVLSSRTLVAILILAACTAHALDVSPREILENPDRFDGRPVTVSGMILNLRETISQKGNPYYTFNLSDNGSAVRVFSFGSSPCRDGSRVTVAGVFRREKHVGRYTFRNEVDADTVKCR